VILPPALQHVVRDTGSQLLSAGVVRQKRETLNERKLRSVLSGSFTGP
jgi:hypothetical protein